MNKYFTKIFYLSNILNKKFHIFSLKLLPNKHLVFILKGIAISYYVNYILKYCVYYVIYILKFS